MLQIIPIMVGVAKETTRFVDKLVFVESVEPVEEGGGEVKVRRQARRNLWLLSRRYAPIHLHNSKIGNGTKT